MSKKNVEDDGNPGGDTGRSPSLRALRDTDRILQLSVDQQRDHPSAVKADHSQLSHINTYGSLPEFYLDLPFICRQCGKRELWKAQDRKWYYEVAKGHIEAMAVECHACRSAKRGNNQRDSL